VALQDFALEPGKRYFVNIGSVGHPRDADPRACYCIYDSQIQSVFWRRVPFDLDAYRKGMEQAGLDPRTTSFLNHDPRRERPAVRQMLCFSPPRTADKVARNVVASQSLTTLRRRIRAWQVVSAAVLAAAMLGMTYGLWELQRFWHRSLTIEDRSFVAPLSLPAMGVNLLQRPEARIPAGRPCPGWSVVLGNRYKQRVEITMDDHNQPVFLLTSTTLDDDLSLSARPMAVRPGMSFYPEALFLKMPGFQGTVAMVASLTRSTDHGEETIDQFYVKEPNQPRPDGWLRAKQKFDIPARSIRIQFHIRGQFRGQVSVKDCTLTATAPKMHGRNDTSFGRDGGLAVRAVSQQAASPGSRTPQTP
jgi:hypothetical protein